jgi:hypothetical protein
LQRATDSVQQAPHCRQHATVATCNVEPTRREACNMWRATTYPMLLSTAWAHPCHIHTGTGFASATSAPGQGLPQQHLRQGWAHPAHTCAGTLSTCPPAAAWVLGGTQVLNHAWLCRFWEKILPALNTRKASTILAQLTDRSSAPSAHICTGPALTLQHLHRDWAHPSPTSAPGLR